MNRTRPRPITRTVTVDVDVDIDLEDLREALGEATEEIGETLQTVFSRVGPENERHCDWRRCAEEPWRSLAEVLR